MTIEQIDFLDVQNRLKERFSVSLPIRQIYANDASIYEEVPRAVAFPNSESDIRLLIGFANQHGLGLIPRTAGTSLAGQVVGSGVVLDVSRHLTRIQEVNAAERWVRVQPGVVRDELNLQLREHQMFFAPETSTSNRAMIGGMFGNNSCGANSIRYGSTRDHIVETTGFLSDGSKVTFGPVSETDFHRKCQLESLEGRIYQQVHSELSKPEIQNSILKNYPKPEVARRNTGFAVDAFLKMRPFGGVDEFNFATFLTGSEGTLFFATEFKLSCEPIVDECTLLLCAQFRSIKAAIKAAQQVSKFTPSRCELIDDKIIAGAAFNHKQSRNLSFIDGNPKAVLLIEFAEPDPHLAEAKTQSAMDQLRACGLGYSFSTLKPCDAKRVWALRKSGLGVVQNRPGLKKPTTVIEDMAVALQDYDEFLTEVDETLVSQFGISCVYYGHVGAGELHLRPELDLGSKRDVIKLREISQAMSELVKKYRGSLSGEHGDGRLRSEHLKSHIGDICYSLIQRIKETWDPNGIFNPNKIVNPVLMDQNLKTVKSHSNSSEAHFHFRREGGFLAAATSCSGSGDCRKSHLFGGTMCPSYMATRDEYDSTRARANLLRQTIANGNILNSKALKVVNDVMDLCLSCKACKSECPSNVDIAKLKSEMLQKQYDLTGTPKRVWNIANASKWFDRFSSMGSLASFILQRQLTKKILGIHPKRSLPKLAKITFHKWFVTRKASAKKNSLKQVAILCDEITNYLDVEIGIAAVELLEKLGCAVVLTEPIDSGRAAVSVGMVRLAKQMANTNVQSLYKFTGGDVPLIVLEPSVFSIVQDEYLDLVDEEFFEQSKNVADQTLLLEEFLLRDCENGRFNENQFDQISASTLIHGHCHQKSHGTRNSTKRILELCSTGPIDEIPSGCCGMAGNFGFEKDKFELSMQIGELVLFPAIRPTSADTIVVANGHSCRHQIADGLGRQSYHLAQILRKQIKPKEAK